MSDNEIEKAIGEPDEIRLTEAEQAAVTDHVNRKAVSPNDACPVCGSPANAVIHSVFRLPTLTSQPVVGGMYQPVLSTACANCGFIRLFNKLIVDRQIEIYEASSKVDSGAGSDSGS